MAQEFSGRTEDAEAPFLTADFWKPGRSVRGAVSKVFTTKLNQSPCYVLELEDSVELADEEWERVSVGNLAGFQMALQAAGVERLRMKDIVEIECTQIKPAKKEGFSPRANFRIKVTRP